MTQTSVITKLSLQIFEEAIARFNKMTKTEILAEGQAIGCKLVPFYSLKKVIAWTVALRYVFVNYEALYNDLIAAYDIDCHECSATPKAGFVPQGINTSDWIGDISEAIAELKIVNTDDTSLNAQHVAYIADDCKRMKDIIVTVDPVLSHHDLADAEIRATIAETLIANGVGQAITPPYNDYHYWLRELQSVIPVIATNGTLASKAIARYRNHGGTIESKMGSFNKKEMLLVVLQELNAVAGYLESFASDRDAGLPIYVKRDNIPAIANFVVGDLIVEAPVNTKVSSNNTLILHSSYECKLRVKGSILTALKMHHSDINEVVVPMIVNHQVSGSSTLVWDNTVFDVEIVGEKFSVVDEILNPATKSANWHKKAFLIKRLITTSNTRIMPRVTTNEDVYSDRYCIPGVLRVSKEDKLLFWCEQFPEWRSSRSIEISRNGGEHWIDVFSWLGYNTSYLNGKKIQYFSLQYEPRE